MIALFGPRCQGKWGEIARRSCGRGRPDLQEALGVETSAAFAERRQWRRHSVGAAALRGSRGLLGGHEAKESRKACLYLLLGRSTPSKTHYTRTNRLRIGCAAVKGDWRSGLCGRQPSARNREVYPILLERGQYRLEGRLHAPARVRAPLGGPPLRAESGKSHRRPGEPPRRGEHEGGNSPHPFQFWATYGGRNGKMDPAWPQVPGRMPTVRDQTLASAKMRTSSVSRLASFTSIPRMSRARSGGRARL